MLPEGISQHIPTYPGLNSLKVPSGLELPSRYPEKNNLAISGDFPVPPAGPVLRPHPCRSVSASARPQNWWIRCGFFYQKPPVWLGMVVYSTYQKMVMTGGWFMISYYFNHMISKTSNSFWILLMALSDWRRFMGSIFEGHAKAKPIVFELCIEQTGLMSCKLLAANRTGWSNHKSYRQGELAP